MANLKEIAQVAYDQIYPNAGSTTSVKVEHFIVVAKTRYAYEMFLLGKDLKRNDGEFEIPSALWKETDLEVENNEADISKLDIFRSFEGDLWIGMVGGGDCDCEYVRHSLNLSQILCDDEYLGNKKPFVVVGNKVKFPKGAHGNKVPIVYASNGTDVDDRIEVDDALADRVGDYLWKRFTGRLPEDRSNNANTDK